MRWIAVIALLLPSVAMAGVVDVCGSCTYTTIADGLAAAVSGDVVSVDPGTWTECYLDVPEEVTLEGVASETVIDGTACGFGALVSVGDAGVLEGLRLEPDVDDGTGVFFLGSGTAFRVEVRGGATLLAGSNDGSATVHVESSLLIGGPDAGTGIDAGFASWTLQQVTLAQVGGAIGVGVSAPNGPMDVQESLISGWALGAYGLNQDCDVELSGVFGNTTAFDGCDEPAYLANWTDDPLYVDPVDVYGDFHLQSSGGQWGGAGFVAGVSDSAYLDRGVAEAGPVAAEADGPCSRPELGGYGGTAEASRDVLAACPVENLDTGTGYRTLAEAVAAGGAEGEILQVRDGVHVEPTAIVLDWGATIVAAAGAEPLVIGVPALDALLEVSTGSQEATVSGLELAGRLDGTGEGVRVQDASVLTLVDVGLQGHYGVRTNNTENDSIDLTLEDVRIGSSELPAHRGVLMTVSRGETATHPVTVVIDGAEVWAAQDCVQILLDEADGDPSTVHILRSQLRCGDFGIRISPDCDGSCQPPLDAVDVLLSASVVRANQSAASFNGGESNGVFSASNNLLVSQSSHTIVHSWTGSAPELDVVNNTIVGGSTGLRFQGSASPRLVRNNLIIQAGNTGLVGGQSSPEYNAFFENTNADADTTLGPTNITTCDPGFPAPPTDPLDPTWDPSAYIPDPTSCLVDAGDPSPTYNDGPGDRNDIGATGGPGGDDFLSLFDLDGDGFAGSSDCDDTDPTVYVGAPDTCGDGLDSDCSGDDAPDADSDGHHDVLCNGDDCDESDAAINPSATDLSCDGVDADCDGLDPTDFDADGFDCDVDDCDDFDASSYPAAPELCDTLDNDCDGAVPLDEQDVDGDGYLGCDDDCDDHESSSYPSAPELCDGLDNDCNFNVPIDEIDGDLDGSIACADCDDADPTTWPDAPEICSDGIDNDCDGTTADEGEDVDGDQVTNCTDCDDFVATVFPSAPELCDLLDNDCDGLVPADEIDADGDGAAACHGECDDTDPAIYPSADELCDGVLQDCLQTLSAFELDGDGDGFIACAECKDDDASVYPGAPELCDELDNDCDGVVPADEEDLDFDGAPACEDCDDNDPQRSPHFTESCDGIDNDCDGVVTDEDDFDGDGFRSCGGDCDDFEPGVNIAAVEICDGYDTDCSGQMDLDEADADGDGWLGCDEPAGAVLASGLVGWSDCDDLEEDRNPGATETCDGLDNDCVGDDPPADEVDGDSDGYLACEECDDTLNTTSPSGFEVCNGVDDNCDGEVDEGFDTDGDGQTPCGGDCDEDRATVFLGAAEICDGLDTDCDDGPLPDEEDEDQDGWLACSEAPTSEGDANGGGDCDDNDFAVYPGAEEICDGKDSDCDGLLKGDEADGDSDGSSICEGDCDDADPNLHPFAAEACDGIDNNCDGLDIRGEEDLSGEADADGDSVRTCEDIPDCDDQDPAVSPLLIEICDGKDNNCDGSSDEGFHSDEDESPDCQDCDEDDRTIYPGAPEECDGIDTDCDGQVDPDDCASTLAPGCEVHCNAGGAPASLLLLLPLLRRRRRA